MTDDPRHDDAQSEDPAETIRAFLTGSRLEIFEVRDDGSEVILASTPYGGEPVMSATITKSGRPSGYRCIAADGAVRFHGKWTAPPRRVAVGRTFTWDIGPE